MKTNVKKLVCFDNEGESFDRFTILNKKTGDLIGASEHPYNPLGFGQYCGNVTDGYVSADVNLCVKSLLEDSEHLGKRIKFSELPKDVQEFAHYYFD